MSKDTTSTDSYWERLEKLKDKDNMRLYITVRNSWADQLLHLSTLIFLYYMIAFISIISNFNIFYNAITKNLIFIVIFLVLTILPFYLFYRAVLNDKKYFEDLLSFLENQEKQSLNPSESQVK